MSAALGRHHDDPLAGLLLMAAGRPSVDRPDQGKPPIIQSVAVPKSQFWRLSSDVGQLHHVALFLRDAADLPVLAGPSVPPRLLGDVPLYPVFLAPADRRRAAGQWTTWWARLLGVEVALHEEYALPSDPPVLAERSVDAGLGGAALPPLDDLVPFPDLQRVARALYLPAIRWVASQRATWHSPTGDVIDWQVASRVAQAVASDYGVARGELRASISVLMVEGAWSLRPAPGVLICSGAVLGPDTCAEMLYRIFEADLHRPRRPGVP